jgi:selenocysteine-specific elongation factor
VRARGLQRHGRAAGEAGAGERVALALATERATLARGSTLVAGDAWAASSLLTLRVRVLEDARAPLRLRQRVRFHLGTAEVLGRLVPLDGAAIDPGGTAWAQLRLEAPVVARAGDRFVLRHYSPVHTIAGGVVAEPTPPARKRITDAVRADLEAVLQPRPDTALAAVRLAGAGGLELSRLPLVRVPDPQAESEQRREAAAPGPLLPPGTVLAGSRLFTAEAAATVREALHAATAAAHRRAPLLPGIDREELRRAAAPADPALVDGMLQALLEDGRLIATGSSIAAAGFRPGLDAGQQVTADALAATLAEAGLAAPRLAELPEPLRAHRDLAAIARHLAADGRLVALAHDHFADAATIRTAVSALRTQFKAGDTLTTADLKQVLPVTRKYLIPLLEYLDRLGVTRREGDARVLLSWRDAG